MNKQTADILRSKLNGLLTERQKNDILNALSGMDKNELMRLFEEKGLNKLTDDQLLAVINQTDKQKLAEAIKNLK